MTKNFCDICGNEIKKDDSCGVFNELKRSLAMVGNAMQPMQTQQITELCKDCASKVSEFVVGLKKV
jgi:hypothetical protein